MKKLFVATLLAASAFSAHAADWFTAPNTGNGMMVLTNETQSTLANWQCNRGNVIYSTNASGQVSTRGCWTADSTWVYVVWDTDQVQMPPHRYPAQNWAPTQAELQWFHQTHPTL